MTWSVQFIFGNRRITVTIPPLVLFLTLAAAGTGYFVGRANRQPDTRELQALQVQNQDLQHALYQKQAELQRTSEIAEARTRQLWDELQRSQAEMNVLWQKLNPTSRRPRLASRSGRRRPHNLQRQVCELQSEVATAGDAVEQLKSAALAHETRERLRHIPAGPPCHGDMTSGFGPRVHPIYGIGRPHNGQDFTTDWGTPIHATADGVVKSADWLGGYGQAVEIDHGNGTLTLYAHCSELLVHKGQRVTRGELIARVGATGLASGPHCHYEVHVNGKPVDPKEYLATSPLPSLKLALLMRSVVAAAQASVSRR